MTKLAALHLRLGVLYALVGMALGLVMGASQDFTLAPVHAHINLLGWVSVMLYGLVYLAFRDRPVTGFMKLHALFAHTGLVIMTVSLAARFLYNTPEGPIIIGSLLAFIGMVMFAVILFGLTKKA